MQWRGLSCQISFYINECETCIRWITWPQSTWPQSGKMDWFFLKSVGGTNWRLIVMIAFPIFQAIGYYSRLPLDFTVALYTVVDGVPKKSKWIKSEKMKWFGANHYNKSSIGVTHAFYLKSIHLSTLQSLCGCMIHLMHVSYMFM